MPREIASPSEAGPPDAPSKSPAPPMAIALLKADHTNAAVLFDAFFAAQADGNAMLKRALAIQIAAELTVHATIEEEIFYPAARAVLGEEGAVLLADAEKDHAKVKELIAQLGEAVEKMPLPAKLDTIVQKISEAVLAHVDEEENDLFPEVQASGGELTGVGIALSQRKQALKDLISKKGRAAVASMAKPAN